MLPSKTPHFGQIHDYIKGNPRMHCDKLIKKNMKGGGRVNKNSLMYLHIILLTSKIAYFGQIHDLSATRQSQNALQQAQCKAATAK